MDHEFRGKCQVDFHGVNYGDLNPSVLKFK